jgi:hypothetical protein
MAIFNQEESEGIDYKQGLEERALGCEWNCRA